MATRIKSPTLELTCPFCGHDDAVLSLNLNDLDSITCGECEQEFSAEEAANKARALARKWDAVVRWIDTAREFVEAGADAE
jgi:transcription elongation factor Elf1